MGKSYRPGMLGGEIQRNLSDMLIRGELKDPGFKNRMIGINSVDVTNDGSYATLYITVISNQGKELSEGEKTAVVSAFEKSKGFIRTELGKRIKARHIPELIFKYDSSYEYGLHMDKVLDSLK